MNLRKNITKMLLLLIISVFSIGTFNSNLAMAINTGEEPYLGQISLFAFNFAPIGWAECTGQTLSVQQNSALFSLIGTKFGGNGATTFQLPDLQNASPIPGAKYYIALKGTYPVRDGSPYSGGAGYDVIGAINIFPYSFAPPGWALCNGQDLSKPQSEALYSLIKNNYGGDGINTYKVPNLTNAITQKYGNYGMNPLGYYICVNGMNPNISNGPAGDDVIGNIDLYAFKFNPEASMVAECKGQIMDTSANSALYALIGTTYGGNGQNNFATPDLRGAVPSPKMGYYLSTVGIFPTRP